ncbi:hypothetical protein [Verrucomicrobium spinosum]|uniref:hypothetical protein n=1 Tax=Verrucomicrobium spinosum TaxID=2736 RepID=UPI0012E10A3E|nr:hypothetical protein [Verrucomicrobium spinosum]
MKFESGATITLRHYLHHGHGQPCARQPLRHRQRHIRFTHSPSPDGRGSDGLTCPGSALRDAPHTAGNNRSNDTAQASHGPCASSICPVPWCGNMAA